MQRGVARSQKELCRRLGLSARLERRCFLLRLAVAGLRRTSPAADDKHRERWQKKAKENFKQKLAKEAKIDQRFLERLFDKLLLRDWLSAVAVL